MIHVSWSEPEDAKAPVIEYPEVCTVELEKRVQAARRVHKPEPSPPVGGYDEPKAALACWLGQHDWQRRTEFFSGSGTPRVISPRWGYQDGCWLIGQECSGCRQRRVVYGGTALYVPTAKTKATHQRADAWVAQANPLPTWWRK